MGLKRIWAAYKRYKEIVKIVSAIIGVVVGISACILFTEKFHNYHAAGWAAFSSVCAFFFLYVVFSVRRDLQRKIQPEAFVLYMVMGGVGLLSGAAVLITYITLGAINHESGADPTGNYVTAVWGFMSLKWSTFSVLSARAYRKMYLGISGENVQIVNS